MKLRIKLLIGLTFSLLTLDYTGYTLDKKWYAQLIVDLPIGTTIDQARIYLKDQGKKHGIQDLQEDYRPDMRGFTFNNQCHSIVTMIITEGINNITFGHVAVRFNESGRLREIYIFE
jgi:hypothetical protein